MHGTDRITVLTLLSVPLTMIHSCAGIRGGLVGGVGSDKSRPSHLPERIARDRKRDTAPGPTWHHASIIAGSFIDRATWAGLALPPWPRFSAAHRATLLPARDVRRLIFGQRHLPAFAALE
jgi:hypothetical protein